MKTPATWIRNPDNDQEKQFTFDYSYWSHSGYKEEDNGLLVATDDNYATQMGVYKDLGEAVLNNCFEGYNTSLFAYGQTGSGKSYSMVGYGPNKGIIPIVCENLFRRVDEGKQNPSVSYQVTVVMMEIYNEQLRDLLHPKVNKKGGLKIRSNKKIGVYIPGLKEEPVDSYEAIERKMQEGTANRTVASTKMNATSSRAHTIFGIMFTKITQDGEVKSESVSKVNLVDLAGSERAESTGATGDRLKEGCAINQSLSSLGNVISALADKAMGKKKVFVPYRNSVLTQMLQDALGGNSRTIMICALSPADVNYEETLSTLRYADRAKKIKNKVQKNENPTDRAIRLLKEENAKLKKLLEGKGMSLDDLKAAGDGGGGGGADPAEMKALKDKLKEMEDNQKMIDEMNKSWDEKLAEAEARGRAKAAEGGPSLASDASKLEIPYLINLHEDEAMTNTFIHKLKDGETKCGRKDSKEKQDIYFAGLGIKKEHCIFEYKDQHMHVTPLNNGKTFINGDKINEKTELHLGDRVVMGSNFFFIYMTPGEHKEVQFKTFKDAYDELMSKQSSNMSDKVSSEMSKLFGADEKAEAKRAELERKLQEMEEKFKAAQAENKRKLEAQAVKYSQMVASGEMSAEDAKRELSAEDKKMNADEAKANEEKKKVQREKKILMCRKKLEHTLDKLIPRIKEMNQVAQEMEKEVKFEVKLQQRTDNIQAILATDQADRLAVMDPVVIVKNKKSNSSYTWPKDKFEQRRYLILEQFQKFQEGELEPCTDADDPFWDPPEPKKIGRAIVFLKSLSHLVEIDHEGTKPFDLTDTRGKPVGGLHIRMLPSGIEDEEIDYLQDPQELVGMSFKIKVCIDSGVNIPEDACNFLHVSMLFQDQTFITPMVKERTTSPNFRYSTVLKFDDADDTLLKYFLKEVAVFELRGFPDGQTPVVEESEMVLKAKFEKARTAWKDDQDNKELHEEFKAAKKAYSAVKKKNQEKLAKMKIEAPPAEEKKAPAEEKKASAEEKKAPAEEKKGEQPATTAAPPTAKEEKKDEEKKGGGGSVEELKAKFEAARTAWKEDQENKEKKEAFKAAKKAFKEAERAAEASPEEASKTEAAADAAPAPASPPGGEGGQSEVEKLKAAFDAARAAWKADQENKELHEAFKNAKKAFKAAEVAAATN